MTVYIAIVSYELSLLFPDGVKKTACTTYCVIVADEELNLCDLMLCKNFRLDTSRKIVRLFRVLNRQSSSHERSLPSQGNRETPGKASIRNQPWLHLNPTLHTGMSHLLLRTVQHNTREQWDQQQVNSQYCTGSIEAIKQYQITVGRCSTTNQTSCSASAYRKVCDCNAIRFNVLNT